jgi:F-type H+-transporting ATPase subunit b
VAQETRDADIAATREELERLRTRAAAEIEAEKGRAIADLRAEVADLAISAAGRVVRASMDGASQRRIVEEFLAETGTPEARA